MPSHTPKNRRFSDRHPELSEREINEYDLNAGTLKLLKEMCKGRSAIDLLVGDSMGTRTEDAEQFDSENIRKMFPELVQEEACGNIDLKQLEQALPYLAEAEEEDLQAFAEKIKTTYAYFVRLRFIYLLKNALSQIDTIGIKEKIWLNFRDYTEHIRFECISLGGTSLKKSLEDINPNDFEKVITFIKRCLQVKLNKYKDDVES